MKPLPFDAPGEYCAQVLARYTDADGHLWVQSMRHAGVIYPPDSPIVAHGKMVNVKGKLVERGETQVEGWTDTELNIQHLEHINFPYNPGDVLLIGKTLSDTKAGIHFTPIVKTDKSEKDPEAIDVVINLDQRQADMSARMWGTSRLSNQGGTWIGKWTGGIAAGGDVHHLYITQKGTGDYAGLVSRSSGCRSSPYSPIRPPAVCPRASRCSAT
jgi:hypothetical protein